MDIKLIRLSNIKYLADKFGRERLAECDERKKWTTNYINQLCGEFASIGTTTSRRIETGLSLAHGWMDRAHPEVTYGEQRADNDSRKMELLALWEQMGEDERIRLLKIGAALADQ